MKKKLIFTAALVSIVICGCYNKENNDGIEKIVSDFYMADYAYEDTIERYAVDDSLNLRVVYEGELFQKPYKEHKKIFYM